MARARRDPQKAMQWQHMDPTQRSNVEQSMSNLGENRTRNVASRISKLDANPSKSAQQAKEQRTLTDVQPKVTDSPMTLASAAKGRTSLYRRAQSGAAASGATVPAGSGWYFEHHADLAKSAKEHGFSTGHAIDASALMSPQNSPDNEKAAVGELMKAHSSGKIHYTPEVHAALQGEGIHSDPSHVGRTVAASELHPSTLAGLTTAKIREVVQPHTNFDLKQMGRGGTKENIERATGVLRGTTTFENELSPDTGPKVTSYREATHNAVPNSADHVEYMSRVEHHQAVSAGSRHAGQDMLDLYGKRHSDEGILNPKGNTAEDTWMNSVSHGQEMAKVPGTRSSVAKTVGSNGSVGYTGSTANQHAWNNRATQQAAANLSRGHDFKLPAVAAQEVPWTQARVEADKDPQHAAASREQAKTVRKAHVEAFKLNSETPGQQTMFSTRGLK